MKVIVIGAVASTQIVLESLVEAGLTPEMLFYLDESFAEKTSGYVYLNKIAKKHNVPHKAFTKINDQENIDLMKELKPDYIFAVGFSQLVSKEILDIPSYGVIGLHPAALPKCRGRAAIVWQMLLGIEKSAISMFLMDEGADSGNIIGQEPFEISSDDYISDVLVKTDAALKKLSDRVVAQMKNGKLEEIKQNEDEATYLLMRTPKDGKINWQDPLQKIHTLIRATSNPYPGAFAIYEGVKVIFWRAYTSENTKYIGMEGQIAYINPDEIAIVCKDGMLHLTDYECEVEIKFRVGHKFE